MNCMSVASRARSVCVCGVCVWGKGEVISRGWQVWFRVTVGPFDSSQRVSSCFPAKLTFILTHPLTRVDINT